MSRTEDCLLADFLCLHAISPPPPSPVLSLVCLDRARYGPSRPDPTRPRPYRRFDVVQDYIDSMEGATKSALLCADRVLEDTPALAKAARERSAVSA